MDNNILSEANIVNFDVVVDMLKQSATQSFENDTQQIQHAGISWWLGPFAKWLRAEPTDSGDLGAIMMFSQYDATQDDPQWMHKHDAIVVSDTGRIFRDTFIDQFFHINDYIRTLDARELSKLYKVTYPQMRVRVNKWIDQIRKQKVGESIRGQDYEVSMGLSHGFFIAKLTTEREYKREGTLMGHCVGGYHERQHTSIYSLRDRKNNPHATIEVRTDQGGPRIVQIKGKQNEPPVEKYIPFIRQFVEHSKFEVLTPDARHIAMYQLPTHQLDKYGDDIRSKYYFIDDPVFQHRVQSVLAHLRKQMSAHVSVLDFSGIPLQAIPEWLSQIPHSVREIVFSGTLFKDLHGIDPNYRGRLAIVSSYKLQSLEGAPAAPFSIEITWCPNLKSLRGLPDIMGDVVVAYANLDTLQGAPRECTKMEILNNRALESLQHAPQYVGPRGPKTPTNSDFFITVTQELQGELDALRNKYREIAVARSTNTDESTTFDTLLSLYCR